MVVKAGSMYMMGTPCPNVIILNEWRPMVVEIKCEGFSDLKFYQYQVPVNKCHSEFPEINFVKKS